MTPPPPPPPPPAQNAYARRGMRPQPRRNNTTLIAGIVVLIVIFLVVYTLASWLLNSVATVGISGPTNITIGATTPAIFSVSGEEYSARLISASASGGSAVIELVQSPAYVNPALRVTLLSGNSTRVSGSSGGYANMEIMLEAINPGNVKVTITPVASSLQLQPNSGLISVAPSVLPLLGSSSGSQVYTTTIAATTSGPTTTVSQAPSGSSIAMAALETTKWYPLMTNLTKMYANGANCTSKQYNNTFDEKRGYVPAGSDTYANVTAVTPTELAFSLSNSSVSKYNATYTAYVSAYPNGHGVALYVAINTTTNTVIANQTIGPFQGLTYSDLRSIYEGAGSITGSCGILYYSAP